MHTWPVNRKCFRLMTSSWSTWPSFGTWSWDIDDLSHTFMKSQISRIVAKWTLNISRNICYPTLQLEKSLNLLIFIIHGHCSLQWRHNERGGVSNHQRLDCLLSGVPDFFDRNKILSGYDLSHYQVPHCIRVFFYFVWFVFIHHNFQFYFKLCTYCNILDIYLS